MKRRLGELALTQQLSLVTLLVIGLTLLLAFAILLWREGERSRTAGIAELRSLAHVIGATSVAALEFGDGRAALENLQAVGLEPRVVAARLYRADGSPLAGYRRPGTASPGPPARADQPLGRRPPRYAAVHEEVLFRGERVGSIFLEGDLGTPGTRLQGYATTVLVAFLVSAAIGVLIAQRAQRMVSKPVEQLTAVARSVAEHADYSLRAPIAGSGELRVLTSTFNLMLGRLAEQDAALRAARDGLEQKVEERVQELSREMREREAAERALKALEDQLRQVQKMDAVGRLAGGVAHDFNNLLGVILGQCELLLRTREPSEERLGQIQAAAQRAAALTRQLLAFSRKQVFDPKLVDLNHLLLDFARMLPRLLGEDVLLEIEPAPGLGWIKADPTQIEQVIMNLAVNSRDAMPRGGRLTIRTSNTDVDEAFARAHPPLQPGRHVTLEVVDTGCGMEPATLSHLFEPFFTTKPAGQGAGMGLATVYGIVKQSGGVVFAESEPGRGAAFSIFLPRVEAAEAPAAPPSEPAPQRGCETILLVEDEDGLRPLVAEMLEDLGYRVITASGADEALRLARRCRDTIDLLLTDIVMPGASGRELAEAIRSQRPDIGVLYMSGYTDDAVIHHGVEATSALLLQKPFSSAALTCRVREALELREQSKELTRAATA